MFKSAAGAAGFYSHQIASSLRNSGAQDGTLKWTAGTPTSSTTFTLSYWVKKYTNSTALDDQNIFVAGTGGGTYFIIGFNTGPEFWSEGAGGNFGNSWIISTAFARDTSAWYHVVHRYDSTQSVSTNRVRLYVNGEQITSFRNQTMQTDIAQDEAISFINESGVVQAFGGLSGKGSGNEGADLQMAEIVFNDGQSYGADSYGEFKNGVWIPKDPSGLTFGDNGYWLKMAAGAIGTDSSGNSNNFTVANIAAHDVMLDSPTFGSEGSANFPAWSPLIKGANNLSEGNVRFDGSGDAKGAITSWAIPTATKYYVEALIKIQTNYNFTFGIANPQFNPDANDEDDATMNGMLFRAQSAGDWNHCSLTNGSRGSFSSDVGQTATRVLGMTVNRVDNEIKMYLDNSLIHTISISATEVYHIVTSHAGGAQAANHNNINAGQDSTGGGDFTAGTATDANGYGTFQHAPPSGFLALCSANLPTADAVDPAETDDDYPQELYSTTLYTGNNADQNINVGLRPDFLWIKRRDATYNNYLFDSTRGVTNEIRSDNNSAQSTTAEGLKAFLSTGFTTGDDATMNENNALMVVRSWRANAGTTSSGSGTLTSTHQVDPSGGFSIVKYVGGNNTWDNPGTVSHGLSRAPDCILLKGLFEVTWEVFHSGVGNGGGSNAASNSLVLDTTAALYTNQTYKTWNGTMPTSSLFTVNGNNANNTNAAGQIAYCFANTEGYIKAGSYEGNGNADGSFVYCGFRPAFIMTKSIDSTSDWEMFDDKRLGYNPDNDHLTANTTAVESTTDMIDILSNGFKFRIATDPNVAETYVYLAIAHNSFKYATAR